MDVLKRGSSRRWNYENFVGYLIYFNKAENYNLIWLKNTWNAFLSSDWFLQLPITAVEAKLNRSVEIYHCSPGNKSLCLPYSWSDKLILNVLEIEAYPRAIGRHNTQEPVLSLVIGVLMVLSYVLSYISGQQLQLAIKWSEKYMGFVSCQRHL